MSFEKILDKNFKIEKNIFVIQFSKFVKLYEKMTITKEYRIILPITVDEYQVAQLYSVAESSKVCLLQASPDADCPLVRL